MTTQHHITWNQIFMFIWLTIGILDFNFDRDIFTFLWFFMCAYSMMNWLRYMIKLDNEELQEKKHE
jgi:hypothetical protein